MPGRLQILTPTDWQMSVGDRAALEGVLTQLRPGLSIEIGTAHGGSLERIAAHSGEVHAIDVLVELLVDRPVNAELHRGRSVDVLPGLLDRLASEGRTVDFALVDGEHTSEAVRGDLEALIDSPALRDAVILVHDSFNQAVRKGIESANLASRDQVAGFELDCVPGLMIGSGPLAGQLWGGFALVVVDRDGNGYRLPEIVARYPGFEPMPLDFLDAYETARQAAKLIDPALAVERSPSKVEELERELEAVESSLSWRITRPLRAAKARLRRGHR